MNRFIAVSFLFLGFTSSNANAVVIFAGQAKAAAVCSQCHGITTPSADAPFPSLAGRDKTRKSDIMNAIAGSLSDTDIDNLAAYYAKQKP